MFEGFANIWTPVALASELKPQKPLAVQVAGTPLVLFRNEEGGVSALVDRCPHRGVALSLGTIKGGNLECPFHGWQLDSKGHVCNVPWNPDAKLQGLRGIAIPVREIAQQLWVYTSHVNEPTSEPAVNETLLRKDVRVSGFAIEWNTHWTRAMENMLDWPHLPFVHKATIGKSMRKQTEQRMDVAWEERPWGAHTYIQINGKAEPGSLDLRWPNQMNLHIPIPNKLLMMLVACVPIDEGRTKMLMIMARNFLTNPIFDWFFHRTNLKIAMEDKAIVESSFPNMVPPASEEKSVRTDAPTLAFRKRYYAELVGSASENEREGVARTRLPMARLAS